MRRLPARSTLASLGAAIATAALVGNASSAQAAAAPEIVDAYVTPVVVLGTMNSRDIITAAAVRGATSVTVSGDRATAGLCAGYDETLENIGPDEDDPTVDDYISQYSATAADYRKIGGNGCAGRWKLVYTAKGAGGTATAVRYGYVLRASRFGSLNAAPEPISAGTRVTSSAVLQRASWSDQRYHAWVTPVQLQFRTTGAWKTYRELTPASNGVVRGTVSQRVSGCWRMVAVGTSTTNDAVSPIDCVTVR